MENQTGTMDSALERILARRPGAGEDPRQVEMQRKRDLLARVRVLREGNLNVSNLLRNQSPDFNYVWVFNHPDRVAHFEGMAAELVKNQDPVESRFKKDDGTHVRGDTILMRMHKDLADAYNAEREIRADEAISGHKQNMTDWAEMNGVPVMKPRH